MSVSSWLTASDVNWMEERIQELEREVERLKTSLKALDLISQAVYQSSLTATADLKKLIERVDGFQELFESAIILEYLDEVFQPQLHPENALQRAKQRGWMEYGSNLLFEQVKVVLAKSEDEYQQSIESLGGSFARLNDHVNTGPYFNGEQFSLIDASYAPLFMRFQILAEQRNDLLDILPSKLQAWSQALLQRPSVKESVVDSFESEYIAFFKSKGSLILNQES